MNNKHILDLTLRLSQSLDQNYDVVSMDTVLSVISALEGTTITKEQLEATRLAKYINQLRRRTKCENLARRAKSLLKKWREMVGIQQSNESSAGATSNVVTVPAATAINSSSIVATAPYNMPVTDNAVSTSHLPNQISHQHYQRQNQYQTNVKQQQQIQQQPYHSQPSSPVNLQEKSNPNEFLISMSNPATGSQMPKSSTTNIRKKKKLEKNANSEPIAQMQQQPTSFANLLTGLGSTYSSTRKISRDKSETVSSSVKPVETFIIEHSSNSNSDLICLPSNNTVNSNFTSATDVPPVVIDLQDTNSSMNSLVSKDVTNASSSFYKTKTAAKKSKKEKKRKERNVMARQNQPLQDCDDQNTTTASYQHKRTSNVLLLDEKSHSACPTISNISEILSLSNSSMSSVFPSTDAMSKNIFQSGHNELASPLAKMSKSDLTFAGKFKQNTSSTLGGSNVLNYNNDSTNVNILSSNSPNQNKFSLFGGIGIGTNSNDSTSNSRTSQFNVVDAIKPEASNSKHNMEDGLLKHDIDMSNMSNKGNSSTDNTFAVGASNITATHQQSIDLTTTDYSSQQNVKQPKKRGRKKGSKGVDSVIAKETSLSSQMLISSLSVAGKKVKTTKELYAEMENRKLRNVKAGTLGEIASNSSATWNTQQQQLKPVNSRRASFFSDIAESDSCTMTSEPSRDSGNVLSKTLGKRETPLDNNSNYSKHDSELKMMCDEASNATVNDPNSTLAITSKIKQEMQEILKLLTPPPSVKEIEYDCFNNMTPCTCTVEEVIAPTENYAVENSRESSDPDLHFNTNNSTNVNEKENNHSKIEQMSNVTDNVKGSDNNQKDSLPQPTPPAKIKKSIFDLDFDDDEDPLNSIIADIAGKNLKAETEIITSPPVIDEKSEIPLSTEDDLGKVDQQNTPNPFSGPTNILENIVFPSYEVKYDEDCKAKNRFEVQTQKITKFHIDTLHNCFIPNVNGNWNHADVLSSTQIKKDKGDNDGDRHANYLITDGYDVVPLYGSDMNEQIVKDLSHVQFTKKFKVKHSKCKNEILFHIPFLGVSRIPDVGDAKLEIKDIKKLKLNEEKENVDEKFNLNNTFITSALDNTKLPNENDGCEAKEMERVQNIDDSSNKNVKISNFKRTKKNVALVKRSTMKRLKFEVNGNLETNSPMPTKTDEPLTSSDSDSDCGDDRNYISDAEDHNVTGRYDNLDKLEDINCDNVNEYHHEVVNHDIADTSDGQNHHIVLTIKKTSSKTNSPLNSLSTLPPVSKNTIEMSQANKENDHQEKHNLEFDEKENSICDNIDYDADERKKYRQKRLRKKRIQHKKRSMPCQRNVNMSKSKIHNTLFYHEEICPIVRNGSNSYKECIFQISSCSSGCSADEEVTNENLFKNRTISSSSASSSSSESSYDKYEGHMLNLQRYIIQSEFEKRTLNAGESDSKSNGVKLEKIENDEDVDKNCISDNDAEDDLPEENNHMLLSFNNIYKKSTREENANSQQQKQQENKDPENNMLKQQLHNCDDYNNLNNNFNLIKYIDNKTSSVNNNNINNNSCSNNYSDTNIIISSSSCNPENPTNSSAPINHKNLNNNDNNDDDNVQIKPFKEYQTGIRAVDEDVNDDDGNNCARLQQFKEWHEVLQLRSYNDELLTVLPYVVLE